MSGARRLIVSGDDFGVAPEVNAAIVRAHRDGILTAASLMVTGAAVDDAIARAHAHPRLAVGLHLVLAQGRAAAPPAEIPHLAADGAFGRQPVALGIRYAWLSLWAAGRAELRREIAAQLDAFRATGLPLAHVDGHLNMHLHPMVLPHLLVLAPRYGIRAMRLSRENLSAALGYDRRHLARKVGEGAAFHALAAWAAPRLRAAGMRVADRVLGMHQTGHVDVPYMLAMIATLPPGVTELYCHPAEQSPATLSADQPGYDHAGELAALTDPRVRSALTAAGIELTNYAAL